MLVGAGRKWTITGSIMLVTVMQVLDTSITNVALPHMQGSFSASIDEMSWVITSYLAANAIVIPASARLTGVFGLVPLVVFGLWGGALADAMDRREIIGKYATNVTDYVAADGSNNVAITADIHDMAGVQESMSSPSPEDTAAQERHGVIPPIMAYVEK